MLRLSLIATVVMSRDLAARLSDQLHRLKRREHILDDIVRMFEAGRDAHQSVADAELGTLRRRQPLVRRRRRMGDEAFGAAEIVADANELERILKPERRFLAAFVLERPQRRAAAHLLLNHGGLW